MSETSNNKRIAKNTLMLYIRMLLSMIVSLYTSRVVLNTLGVEDYGIYGVVGGIVIVFSFLNSAMSVATQRFLNFELGKQNHDEVKSVFNMSMNIYVLIAFLIVILCETIGIWFFYTKLNIPADRIDAAIWVYQMSVLSCCLSVIRIPYNALVIAYEKMSFFAYVSIAEVLLKLLTVIILVYIEFDHLIMYSILLAIVSFIIVIFYILYCRLHFSVSKYSFYWDKYLFYKLASYSAWNLFGASAGVAKDQGINFLLNIFFSPSVNAVHSISMQVNSAVFQFYNSLLVAAQPQIIKYYAANELNQMYNLVYLVVKTIYILLIIITIPIFYDTEFVLKLWLGIVPDYSISFIRILILITCIDAMATPLMSVAHATGRIKLYQSVVGTITLCIIPVSYIFLSHGFEPTIVYIVSLVVSICNFFIRLYFVKCLADFPVFNFLTNVMFRIVIMTILLVCIMYFVRIYLDDNSFIIAISRIAISSTLSLFCFYFICFDKKERKMFHMAIDKFKYR